MTSRIPSGIGVGRRVSWSVRTQTISPVASSVSPPFGKTAVWKVMELRPMRVQRAPISISALRPIATFYSTRPRTTWNSAPASFIASL